MTELEWLCCRQPLRMLDVLAARADDRRLLLFACACIGRNGYLLADDAVVRALQAVERFADGPGGEEDVLALARTFTSRGLGAWSEVLSELVNGAADRASGFLGGLRCQRTTGAALRAARRVARQAAEAAEENLAGASRRAAHRAERNRQCNLLRCLFGNPFRRVALDPACRGAVSAVLAQAGYEERPLPCGPLDPAPLAILADALDEAGCAERALLGHLRAPGPHARGC